MCEVPRMRTVKEVAAFFKEQDPETKVSEWNIRRMIKEEKIPYEMAGTRFLINLDLFIERMKGA